ncbi:hypothetical protein [Ralstonia pseudosolanacearum]
MELTFDVQGRTIFGLRGMTSPELTGGAGFTYEDAVAAYYLVGLVGGTTATELASRVVERVAQQQADFGEPLDDVIVDAVGLSDGTPMRLSLQKCQECQWTPKCSGQAFSFFEMPSYGCQYVALQHAGKSIVHRKKWHHITCNATWAEMSLLTLSPRVDTQCKCQQQQASVPSCEVGVLTQLECAQFRRAQEQVAIFYIQILRAWA